MLSFSKAGVPETVREIGKNHSDGAILAFLFKSRHTGGGKRNMEIIAVTERYLLSFQKTAGRGIFPLQITKPAEENLPQAFSNGCAPEY